jgi:hypothetical protein
MKLAKPVLILLVCAALLASVLAIVLDVGLRNTPYETRDSVGRPMGFNDRLSAEHYGIVLKNFTFGRFAEWVYLYDWILLAMQIAGIALLLSRQPSARKAEFWFFAAQPLLFPLALLAVPMIWLMPKNFVEGHVCRQTITDIPFIACTAHPLWVLTAILIAVILRKDVFREEWLRSRASTP